MLIYIVAVPAYYMAQTIAYHREVNTLKKAVELQQTPPQGEDDQQAQAALNDKVRIIRNNFRTKVLFEEYHIDSYWQYGFMMQFCVTRLVYAYVLAKMYSNVDFQIYIMTVMSVAVSIIYLSYTKLQTMTFVAMFRPFRYPFRNLVAIVNEAAVFYIMTASMVWVRSDLFCSMAQREFVAPMSLVFTSIMGAQAFVWIVCQFTYFSQLKGKQAPVSVAPEVVPRNPKLNMQYREAKQKANEERKRLIEENKTKDKGDKKSRVLQRPPPVPMAGDTLKANKADDDQLAGLPDASEDDKAGDDYQESYEEEKTESLVSQDKSHNKADDYDPEEEDEELTEIELSKTDESGNTQSRNQTYDEEEEEDSGSLERDSEEDVSQSNNRQSSYDRTSDVPDSSFKR